VGDTVTRRSPGAVMALRLTRGGNLFVLSSDSGLVALTSVQGNRASGRFMSWFARPGAGPVLLSGAFQDVTAVPDPANCEQGVAPPPPPPAPDSVVS
jgi:hypothetical protein